MKKLAIFDLDGTLLNTIADLADATNYALRQLGISEHPLESYPTFVGNGIGKLFERALPPTLQNAETVERVRAHFVPYYDAHNADKSTPYEGITALLEQLQSRHIQLAVASNKYQSAAEKLVRHFFPTVRFVSVLGQREGVPSKPHPQIVLDILQTAGITAADTLYIGDSGVDMQTACAAAVERVGVTWGFRPQSELEANGAQHIANQPNDILQWMG